jgi:hypothetical protein
MRLRLSRHLRYLAATSHCQAVIAPRNTANYRWAICSVLRHQQPLLVTFPASSDP